MKIVQRLVLMFAEAKRKSERRGNYDVESIANIIEFAQQTVEETLLEYRA